MIKNYSKYSLNFKEFIVCLLLNTTVIIAISIIFYDSLVPIIFLTPFSFLAIRLECNYLCLRRKKILVTQFKETLNSLAISLSIGYSLENALKEAYIEMSKLYGKSSLICTELTHILRQTSLGTSIEEAFSNFAMRSCEPNIINFSEVLSIAKRSSGNISQIVNEAALRIRDKIELDRELHSIISAKNYEKNIMCAMPPAIIIYIRFLSPGFLTPMYSTILGRIIMTFCLIFYVFTIWLSSRITNIGRN